MFNIYLSISRQSRGLIACFNEML